MKTNQPLRCWAEIDLPALVHNWQTISQSLSASLQFFSVVKANAYGHGVFQVVKCLKNLPQIKGYCVANPTEGREVRLIDLQKPVLVLGSPLEEEYSLLFEHNLTTIVSSVDEIQRLSQFAQRAEKKLGVHLKIDTGTGRMGTWFEEAKDAYSSLLNSHFLELKGVSTHFASSPTDPEFTRLQRLRFLETLSSFPNLNFQKLHIHCDNSAGIASFEDNNLFNTARIGLLQYGILPGNLPKLKALDLKPVLSLHARLSLVKSMPAGESVSYGRLYFLKRPSKIAILTAGYNDCIPIPMTNRGSVIIRGQRCPLIGRVAMDQVVIDVTDCPEASVGDQVTLIGKQSDNEITIEEFSHNAQSIPWQCLCAIGNRVSRVYSHLHEIHENTPLPSSQTISAF